MRRALTFNVQTLLADPIGLNAVYLYFGWGNPPNPVSVMEATGLKQFSLFAVWSDDSGNPQWEGYRGLSGATETTQISAIRAAGGDVVVTFGGAGDDNLGVQRTTAASLANAYQSVIDLYALRAIDIDLEGSALWDSAAVRQRVMDALKIIQTNNPGIKIYITVGALPDTVYWPVKELMDRGAAIGLDAVWTGMAFWWDSHVGTMADATVASMEPFRAYLQQAYGYSTDVAYRHVGISSNNGVVVGKEGEVVTVEDFSAILSYARSHHMGRLTFWALGRDRQCGGQYTDPLTVCSGTTQDEYAFTRMVASYHG